MISNKELVDQVTELSAVSAEQNLVSRREFLQRMFVFGFGLPHMVSQAAAGMSVSELTQVEILLGSTAQSNNSGLSRGSLELSDGLQQNRLPQLASSSSTSSVETVKAVPEPQIQEAGRFFNSQARLVETPGRIGSNGSASADEGESGNFPNIRIPVEVAGFLGGSMKDLKDIKIPDGFEFGGIKYSGYNLESLINSAYSGEHLPYKRIKELVEKIDNAVKGEGWWIFNGKRGRSLDFLGAYAELEEFLGPNSEINKAGKRVASLYEFARFAADRFDDKSLFRSVRAVGMRSMFGQHVGLIENAHRVLTSDARYSGLEGAIEVNKQLATGIESQLDKVDDTVEKGQKKLGEKENKLNELRGTVQDDKKEIKELVEAVSVIDRELDKMKDPKYLTEVLDKLNAHVLLERAMEVIKSRGEIYHNKKMSIFNSELRELQASLEKLDQLVENVEKKILSHQEDLKRLGKQGDSISERSQAYRRQNRAEETKYTDRLTLKPKVDALVVETESWWQSILKVCGEIDWLDSDYRKQREEIEETGAKVKKLEKDVEEHKEKPAGILRAINRLNQMSAEISEAQLPKGDELRNYSAIIAAVDKIRSLEGEYMTELGLLKDLVGGDSELKALIPQFQGKIDLIKRNMLERAGILRGEHGRRGAYSLTYTPEYMEFVRQGLVPRVPDQKRGACTLMTKKVLDQPPPWEIFGVLPPGEPHIYAANDDGGFDDYVLGIGHKVEGIKKDSPKKIIGGGIVNVATWNPNAGIPAGSIVLPIPPTGSYESFCLAMGVLSLMIGGQLATCPATVYDPFESYPKNGWSFRMVYEGI